jgi:hypothetical protein
MAEMGITIVTTIEDDTSLLKEVNENIKKIIGDNYEKYVEEYDDVAYEKAYNGKYALEDLKKNITIYEKDKIIKEIEDNPIIVTPFYPCVKFAKKYYAEIFLVYDGSDDYEIMEHGFYSELVNKILEKYKQYVLEIETGYGSDIGYLPNEPYFVVNFEALVDKLRNKCKIMITDEQAKLIEKKMKEEKLIDEDGTIFLDRKDYCKEKVIEINREDYDVMKFQEKIKKMTLEEREKEIFEVSNLFKLQKFIEETHGKWWDR